MRPSRTSGANSVDRSFPVTMMGTRCILSCAPSHHSSALVAARARPDMAGCECCTHARGQAPQPAACPTCRTWVRQVWPVLTTFGSSARFISVPTTICVFTCRAEPARHQAAAACGGT